MAPWPDCGPCHSQPDGARLPLTRHPANGTSPPTRARSASEPLLPHAALTISPSAATAGPQHPLGVATAPCTQPYLLDQALTVSFHCLPSLVSPTWLHPFDGFGFRNGHCHLARMVVVVSYNTCYVWCQITSNRCTISPLKSVTLSNVIQAIVGVLPGRVTVQAANWIDYTVRRLNQHGRLPFKVCHFRRPGPSFGPHVLRGRRAEKLLTVADFVYELCHIKRRVNADELARIT